MIINQRFSNKCSVWHIKKQFPLMRTVFISVVPPARIELAIDPYHGSVIPLN